MKITLFSVCAFALCINILTAEQPVNNIAKTEDSQSKRSVSEFDYGYGSSKIVSSSYGHEYFNAGHANIGEDYAYDGSQQSSYQHHVPVKTITKNVPQPYPVEVAKPYPYPILAS
ncbi:uncharacterized protein LOC112599783 [Melanaphis sacchari]|uniref:uncharacterized protein LOC112599783 n=1 Tax=Melanaphis sacchari TaxID=742174 RepID=UPI000DC141B9|nr:uncharacterized protein LOC112599783 [Melanaphis sacchari]